MAFHYFDTEAVDFENLLEELDLSDVVDDFDCEDEDLEECLVELIEDELENEYDSLGEVYWKEMSYRKFIESEEDYI